MFRHEAGKMTAVLARIFGLHHIELAEDVVQEAFLKAVQVWKFDNIPSNPAGWLMQVAKNKAIDIIRRQEHFKQFSSEVAAQLQQEALSTVEQFFLDTEIADSQLRMIFACCHPLLKEEDQVALTLKTVSGFGVAEIARALITNEAVIQKRLFRARKLLKENNTELQIPCGTELTARLNTVYTVLYLLFNEGYNSLKADELIRKDLCAEAMRLCLLLSQHKSGNQPPTFALLAMMCFHAARFDSRLNEQQEIVLLQHQDRSVWSRELINRGYHYLNQSAAGNQLTVYHIESAIAAEHCLATAFENTNWQRLLQLYDLLLEYKRTPVVLLNRAIVLAQLQQVTKAIGEIWDIDDIDTLLSTQYIFSAVLGDLYCQLKDKANAEKFLQCALELTTSIAEKKLIGEKLKGVML
ncbi:MAG: sigma-70 family RNA polymerase sigma factor [Chitinophagaceae bacterium]